MLARQALALRLEFRLRRPLQLRTPKFQSHRRLHFAQDFFRTVVANTDEDVVHGAVMGSELARSWQLRAEQLHPVLGGQGVDLSERAACVLGEPSGVEELDGPCLAFVVAPRFDTLLVAAVFANH